MAGTGASAVVSLGALGQIDGDWIFAGTHSDAGTDAQAMRDAVGQPAYAALKAVRANHFIVVDGSVWTSRGGLPAANVVLDDVRTAAAGS